MTDPKRLPRLLRNIERQADMAEYTWHSLNESMTQEPALKAVLFSHVDNVLALADELRAECAAYRKEKS